MSPTKPLDGRGGDDTADFGHTDDGVVVDLAGTVAMGASIGTDTLLNIEIVLGGTGADTLMGGDGVETLRGGDGADDLQGRGGDDHLFGEMDADLLQGGDGEDSLNGGQGDDTLFGDVGDDTLKGGAGDDSLNGGDGTDFVSLADAQTAITVDLFFGTATGDPALGDDQFSQIENVTAGDFDDLLLGGAEDNVLEGGNGNDTLEGGTGDDTLDGQNARGTWPVSTVPAGRSMSSLEPALPPERPSEPMC